MCKHKQINVKIYAHNVHFYIDIENKKKKKHRTNRNQYTQILCVKKEKKGDREREER